MALLIGRTAEESIDTPWHELDRRARRHEPAALNLSAVAAPFGGLYVSPEIGGELQTPSSLFSDFLKNHHWPISRYPLTTENLLERAREVQRACHFGERWIFDGQNTIQTGGGGSRIGYR